MTASRQRHENLSWGMILGHSNAATYSVQQTQGVAAVMLQETWGKSIIWCWPCTLDCYFWPSDTTLVRSPIVQQEQFRSLISAMTVLKTLPRWHKHIRCCGVVSNNNDTSVILLCFILCCCDCHSYYQYDTGNCTYWTVFLIFPLSYTMYFTIRS